MTYGSDPLEICEHCDRIKEGPGKHYCSTHCALEVIADRLSKLEVNISVITECVSALTREKIG